MRLQAMDESEALAARASVDRIRFCNRRNRRRIRSGYNCREDISVATCPRPPLSGIFWTDPETVLDPPTTTQDTGPDSPGRDRSDTPLRSAADDESVHSHGRTPVRAQSRSCPFSDSLIYLELRDKTVPLTSDALCLLHYGSNLFYFRKVEIRRD